MKKFLENGWLKMSIMENVMLFEKQGQFLLDNVWNYKFEKLLKLDCK